MKILVLDINYPSDTNLYGDVFVHVRVQGYIERGHDVHVLAFFTRGASYTFEGVKVRCVANIEQLRSAIAEIAPDVIAIHFFQGWMLEKLVLGLSVPVIVWVHGGEALGWYRRLFDFQLNAEFARYIAFNTLQLSRMRRLYDYAQRHTDRVALIFVSKWMHDIAARDAFVKIKQYAVIPNPIDTNLFGYEQKNTALRGRVLLIRSFGSRKYANDLAVRTIQRLSGHRAFKELSFTIVGSGKYFASLTQPLRAFPNVTLNERFLDRASIRALHSQHGLFLCPTRQDAQGVSMCEAMSSGLVPISSHNTAIPEFVENGVDGFLCNSPEGLSDAIAGLWEDPDRFQRMSMKASTSIATKAASSQIVPSELALMQSMVRK